MSAIAQPKQEQYLFSMVAIPTYIVSVETLPCKKKGPVDGGGKEGEEGE